MCRHIQEIPIRKSGGWWVGWWYAAAGLAFSAPFGWRGLSAGPAGLFSHRGQREFRALLWLSARAGWYTHASAAGAFRILSLGVGLSMCTCSPVHAIDQRYPARTHNGMECFHSALRQTFIHAKDSSRGHKQMVRIDKYWI